MTERKRLWALCIRAAALAGAGALCARLLLQNLYRFLTFDPTFYDIFAQIRDAAIRPPVAALTLAAVGISCLADRMCGRKILRIFVCILLWLLLAIVGVLLTRVNGIRFADVLFSLLDVLRKGGL